MIPFMENYESIFIHILCANNRNVLQVASAEKEHLRRTAAPRHPLARSAEHGLAECGLGSDTCGYHWAARQPLSHPPLPGLKDPTPLISDFLASVSFSAGQMGSEIEDNLY